MPEDKATATLLLLWVLGTDAWVMEGVWHQPSAGGRAWGNFTCRVERMTPTFSQSALGSATEETQQESLTLSREKRQQHLPVLCKGPQVLTWLDRAWPLKYKVSAVEGDS